MQQSGQNKLQMLVHLITLVTEHLLGQSKGILARKPLVCLTISSGVNVDGVKEFV